MRTFERQDIDGSKKSIALFEFDRLWPLLKISLEIGGNIYYVSRRGRDLKRNVSLAWSARFGNGRP